MKKGQCEDSVNDGMLQADEERKALDINGNIGYT
jgi:hypothetical protein